MEMVQNREGRGITYEEHFDETAEEFLENKSKVARTKKRMQKRQMKIDKQILLNEIDARDCEKIDEENERALRWHLVCLYRLFAVGWWIT